MSLLPLTVFDCIRRAYRSGLVENYVPADAASALAERIIASACLSDVIRWRNVSRAFRNAAQQRIGSYSKLTVRVYDGLAELRDQCANGKGTMKWPSAANVLVCEVCPGTVGICVDSKLCWKDAKTMIGYIAVFRASAEQVFMDSPIIDLLLKHLNSTKVHALLQLLSEKRRSSFLSHLPVVGTTEDSNVVILPQKAFTQPVGPFFPRLKQFTVTANKSQLSHLARVVNYAVAVENLFEKDAIDLVCLQVILGESWCRSKQPRLFRHVSSFKQWLDASSLGVKYVQQFQGDSSKRKRFVK